MEPTFEPDCERMPLKLVENPDDSVTMRIKVVPGASRDRIVGELGDELKIAVSKPPQGGQANKAVIKLLHLALGLPSQHISIVSGHGNPRKQIRISGISAVQIRDKLRV